MSYTCSAENMGNVDKFLLLTWKNWLLQWRHKTQTAFEVLAPVFFSILLVLIRSLVDPETRKSINFHAFELGTTDVEVFKNKR